MHLAIACLGQSTPPVSIVYQGKFEGLMAHFGLDGLTFAPDAVGQSPEPDTQLAAATDQAAALRQKIAQALPGVTALSQSNFKDF